MRASDVLFGKLMGFAYIEYHRCLPLYQSLGGIGGKLLWIGFARRALMRLLRSDLNSRFQGWDSGPSMPTPAWLLGLWTLRPPLPPSQELALCRQLLKASFREV